MSRYIDYDAIDYRNDKMHDKSSDFIDGVIYMAQRIEDAPSIDIVRCKECRYYVPWDDTCGGCEYLSNSDYTIGVSGHFFCADGEREVE